MNFADIENAWRSPHNRPNAAELEKQKMNFIADLRRRRRAALGLLCISAIPLVFLTGKVVLHVIAPDPSLARVDLGREWAIVPFFALPWIGWLALLRQYVTAGRRHRDYASSINASLAALLDETRTQRTLHAMVGVLLVISAAILPLIVHQLRAVGKVGDEIVIPAYVVYPVYVFAMVGWIVWNDRRKLLPRLRELEGVISAYRQA